MNNGSEAFAVFKRLMNLGVHSNQLATWSLTQLPEVIFLLRTIYA